MAVNVAREGHELWRPNREKAQSKTTKGVVALVFLISAGLLLLVALGGWTRLESPSVGVVAVAWALFYVIFALLVLRWNRGVLPVAAGMAMIMAIFAAIAAPHWFARAKPGLSSPALDEDLLGLLTLVVIPVQLVLIAIAMIGFNQNWHVEEERPIAGGAYDDDARPAAYDDDDDSSPANRPELADGDEASAEHDRSDDAQAEDVRAAERSDEPPTRSE